METSLFDRTGHATAYVADDGENSIYLWKGQAVAYVDKETIYGWNGHHLGFFVDGILYDLRGRRVGFVREACPVVTKVERVKFVKKVKHVKHVRHVAHVRPVLSNGYSDEDLADFLQQGAT
jgi:hypothetical protein